jgi:glycosyltransferase involved in cell wall biosynthesis
MNYKNLKIGYVPLNSDLTTAPGDYRRFVKYANIRGIRFDIANTDKIYDIVVVSQGADITLWRDYEHGVIVYDLIDSYLSIPKTNIKGVFRGIAKYISRQHYKLDISYWSSVKKMCLRADIVICSTKEQRNKILPYCSDVRIILDYHDDVVKNPKIDYKIGNVIKLVWEGMPSNLYQLRAIKKPLLRLYRKYKIELHIVTNIKYKKFLGSFWLVSSAKEARRIFPNSIVHEWTKENVSGIVRNCDIAIIPIDGDYSLTKNKPENKLLFFWRMGIPVVSSNIPSYRRTMNNAGLNYDCENESEWYIKIEKLILDYDLRKNYGASGKKYALECYGSNRINDEWDSVIIKRSR